MLACCLHGRPVWDGRPGLALMWCPASWTGRLSRKSRRLGMSASHVNIPVASGPATRQASRSSRSRLRRGGCAHRSAVISRGPLRIVARRWRRAWRCSGGPAAAARPAHRESGGRLAGCRWRSRWTVCSGYGVGVKGGLRSGADAPCRGQSAGGT